MRNDAAKCGQYLTAEELRGALVLTTSSIPLSGMTFLICTGPRRRPKMPTTMRLSILRVLILSFAAYAAAQIVPSQNIGNIEAQFKNPPDDSRIMMRWWWLGPSVTKPRLEREMRLMKEGGIGGVEVQSVYPVALDDPATGIKNLPFLSDEFIDALRFTADKARELGLRLDLTLGSGWPYGGPSVTVDDASGRLRIEQVKLGNDSRRVVIPSLGGGEKLIAAFLVRAEGERVVPESMGEISNVRDGVALLPTDLEGRNTVYFFISSRTGMQVKRPALGAEGFVLDHLNGRAARNYL